MQKVALYVRICKNGKQRYELADPKVAYKMGTPFVLRYVQDGKRVWQTLNNCPNYIAAEAARRRLELDFWTGDTASQRDWHRHYTIPKAAPKPAAKTTLGDWKEKFLQFKKTTKRKDGTPLDGETLTAYQQQVTEFLAVAKKQYADQIDGQDLRNYMEALRVRGLSHRSVCNNYTSVATFLKFCGVDHKALLPYNERPTPDDGTPEAYSEEELRKFFAALRDERHRLAFEVLLKTGLREREMTTLEWADLNLGKDPAVTIQARKPHLKFRVKTGKGRTIPLERNLALKLAAWKMKNGDRKLVFGTASDKEDSHFWRVCKETAEKAGMKPENWWLHKFRDTFGTLTCRAGQVDLRTLQHWMGHASITMTEKYLAPGGGAYAQQGINQTFNISLGEDLATTAAVQ